MKQRLYIATLAITGIILFEFYINVFAVGSGSLPRCFATGAMFPYKDANGVITYDSVYHTIADFKLTDQNGATFTNSALRNKVYVADFFFVSCPTICPNMTKSMLRLQQAFLNDTSVAFLSHTVSPEHDSVPVLKRYELKNKIDGKQWHILTGARKDLYDLSKRSYYLGVRNDSPDYFLHSEKFVLVDNHRVIRGYYDGTDSLEVDKLRSDIKTLLKEISNNTLNE